MAAVPLQSFAAVEKFIDANPTNCGYKTMNIFLYNFSQLGYKPTAIDANSYRSVSGFAI
jgi:hypothetical protein